MAAFVRLSCTYESILHAIAEGIFSLDPEGRIAFANAAAGNMLAWPLEDLAGMPWCVVRHGAGVHAGEACPLPGLSRQEIPCRRDVFRQRNGIELLVEYSLTPLLEEGRQVGLVLIFRDVGERERTERALQESRRCLSTTRDQLLQAEKLAAIGRIAAGIAHEINSPLGYIGANVSSLWYDTENLIKLVEAYERAAAAPGDPEAAAGLAAARRRCDLDFMREDAPALLRETGVGLAKVTRIVRELREYADAGDSGEWQWAEVAPLLDAALADALAREDRQARVERDYVAVAPIHCLAMGLRHAFTSLLLNALQALTSPAGRITLRVGPGAAGEVLVTIEDDGIGIAPEHLEQVRDPFFTTRPVGTGIGMGLSVADATVRRHGGRIDIDSRPGAGTRVAVSLPLAPGEADGAPGPCLPASGKV